MSTGEEKIEMLTKYRIIPAIDDFGDQVYHVESQESNTSDWLLMLEDEELTQSFSDIEDAKQFIDGLVDDDKHMAQEPIYYP